MSDTKKHTTKKTGRPTKFTPQTRARLVALVARGVPFNHACAAVKISFVSFLTYREKHRDFAEEIEAASACAMDKRLLIIEKAAESGDVNCAKWLLEHLHPEHFARNRIELIGANGKSSPPQIIAPIVQFVLPAKQVDEPEPELQKVIELPPKREESV